MLEVGPMNIEHQIPNLGVTGSNPVGVASEINMLAQDDVPQNQDAERERN
jgi:hypothetical protein